MRIRKFLLCIMAIIIAMQLMGATIDPGMTCSLTVHLVSADSDEELKGVSVGLIPVCDMTEEGLVYNDAFASFGQDVFLASEKSYTEDLVQYAEDNAISGDVLVTDSEGKAVFEDLAPGMYLVIETDTGDLSEVFSPFLTILPSEDGPDVIAEPKTTAMSKQKKQDVTVTVTKVWNDDGQNRPESVKINLKNEDGIYDTVTLTAESDWKFEWESLPGDKEWSVEEASVPEGYTVTYKSDGNDFTVTNTSKLVQTGIEQRPVPVLFVAGILLLGAGLIVKATEKKR